MKKYMVGALAAGVLAAAGAAGVVLGGYASVAADVPHSSLVYGLLDMARQRAVVRNAADLEPPGDLNDSERVRRGAGNYAAMCAECHLSPGVTDSEIRKGLYPVPPDLANADPHTGHENEAMSPAERFWVIKHGIKSTAMAAWGKGGMTDENIWDLVALLEVLPRMGTAEYRSWVATSGGHMHGDVMAGGDEDHHHGGGDAEHHEGIVEAMAGERHHAGEAAAAPTPSGHTHAPGTPPHQD
jgi:hypothetical protein